MVRIGRNFISGAAVGAVVATLVCIGDVALAGNGIGSVLHLGTKNTVNNTTRLTGSSSKPLLDIRQRGTGASALHLHVQPGVQPLVVNSTGWVRNLNADYLDGIDSSGFVRGSGRLATERTTEAPGAADRGILTVPKFGYVIASCGSTPGFQVSWSNTLANAAADVWFTDGVAAVTFATVAKGDAVVVASGADPRVARIEIALGDGTIADVTVAAQADSGGCVFEARAEFSPR